MMKSLKGLKLLLFITFLLGSPLASLGNDRPGSCRLSFSENGSTQIDFYAHSNLVESLRVLRDVHSELVLKLQEPTLSTKLRTEYESQVIGIEQSIRSLEQVTQSFTAAKTKTRQSIESDSRHITQEELDALLKDD
jgi:hypothetical protein